MSRRTCAAPGCSTILSRYNDDACCSLHAEAEQHVVGAEVVVPCLTCWAERVVKLHRKDHDRYLREHQRCGSCSSRLRRAREARLIALGARPRRSPRRRSRPEHLGGRADRGLV